MYHVFVLLASCERVFNVWMYANGVSLNMYHVFVLDIAFLKK